jgi:peptide/nickel transport system permease protein
VLGAVKRYSVFDYLATTGAMVAMSFPTFWFGLMAIYIFAEKLRVLPAGGMETIGSESDLGDRLAHLVLPASVLALVLVAEWSRYARNSMLDVINHDYVRTAHAKGLATPVVLMRHAFRNALIPLVVLAGVQTPYLLGGALVTESIFSWPGMGRLFVDALTMRDYPVMMAVLMLTAFLVVASNLLADAAVALVDPRVRLQ